MDTVWIRTHEDVLVRAKSIMTFENTHDGLYAECITGTRVKLTSHNCSMSSQLALLEEIRQAEADDSRAVVIMLVREQDSLIWHREFADMLADKINEHDIKAKRIGVAPGPRR